MPDGKQGLNPYDPKKPGNARQQAAAQVKQGQTVKDPVGEAADMYIGRDDRSAYSQQTHGRFLGPSGGGTRIEAPYKPSEEEDKGGGEELSIRTPSIARSGGGRKKTDPPIDVDAPIDQEEIDELTEPAKGHESTIKSINRARDERTRKVTIKPVFGTRDRNLVSLS